MAKNVKILNEPTPYWCNFKPCTSAMPSSVKNKKIFLKMGQPQPLFCLFSVFFKKTFMQQINVKCLSSFRTHDLLNMSRHP